MPNTYNPYGSLDNWYGVPDYGGAYNNYMSQQMQPLPLSRLVSMVREIQQGMGSLGGLGQPIGQQAVNVSMPTQMQIPAQIAASIMNTGNRLLSMPRQQMAQSGSNEITQPAPEQNANTPANAPARTGGGSGGDGSDIQRALDRQFGTSLQPRSAGGNLNPVASPVSSPRRETPDPNPGVKYTATGKTAAGLHW